MVDRTRLVTLTWRCDAGHNTRAPGWGVIDTRSRPDLISAIPHETTWRLPCVECGGTGCRYEPLLVVVGGEIPIGILAVDNDAVQVGQLEWLMQQAGALSDEPEVFATVGDIALAVLAAYRDVESDVEDPDAVVTTLVRDRPDLADSVQRYGGWLRALANARDVSRRLALVGDALVADSPAALRELIDECPELLDDRTLALLQAELTGEDDRRIELGIALVTTARADVDRAWQQQQEAAERLTREFAAEWDALADAIASAAGDPPALRRAAEDALQYANAVAAPPEFVAMALDARATASWSDPAGPTNVRIRDAIRDYEAALELTTAEDPARPSRLMNAAVAHARDVGGDRASHLARAIELLEQALAEVDDDPRLAATLQTNLAQTILQVLGNDGEQLARRAETLCRAALEYRSLGRDAEDWAYSMIVLGVALDRAGDGDIARREEVIACYSAVVDAADVVPASLLAQAHAHLLYVRFEDVVGMADATPEDWGAVRDLARAVLGVDGRTEELRARAAYRLGVALVNLDEDDAAIAAYDGAIESLTHSQPLEAVRAAQNLAAMLADREDWAGAAETFRIAVRTADTLTGAYLDQERRLSTGAQFTRLHRWAAHAFVKAGALEDAVTTLEDSRMRELRRALAQEDPEVAALRHVAPQLLGRWQGVQAGMVSPLTSAGLDQLDDVLEEIRSIPGFESFAAGATVASIAEAATPDRPVIYVNPTPHGTDLIVVDHKAAVAHRGLPVTSQQVVFRILFGIDVDQIETLDEDGIEAAAAHTVPSSYILAAAGEDDDGPDLDEALDRLLPWIGDRVARHIFEVLDDLEATGATVVAAGPLSTVPLQAACWDGGTCLLDRFTVSATSSARVHAACARRAEQRTTFACLVAVADPTSDLAHTRDEVATIGSFFQHTVIAEGDEATTAFVRQHAAEASVIHLACHGFGGMVDGRENGVVLSDGAMSGADLAALGPLQARLAVASACQTGVVEIGDQADEAFSAGAALLFAGVAATIASMWSVDDLATAMLITKMYELLSGGATPADALADAQRWLRRATRADAAAFASRYPALERRMRSRTAPPPGRPGVDLEFGLPSAWAAFVCHGA